MKKYWKKILAAVLAALVLTAGVYCLLRFGFSIDVLDRSGWNEKDDTVRYLDYYGRPQVGWQYIDHKLYYFQPDTGAMATGWADIDGHRYFFGTDGVRATGWQTEGDNRFYLKEDGKMVTGWQQIDGENFYFTSGGAMATGWIELDGKRYCFSQEGKALSGWIELEGKRYYLTDEGQPLTGWAEVEGARYLFDADGATVSGWFEDETGKFYLADGLFHTGWLTFEENRYYFDENGKMVTGWLSLEKDRYYLHADGKMAVGEVKIEDQSHFFASTGKYVLLCNQWHAVPEDYQMDLVRIEGYQIEASARDALVAMLAACRETGLTCVIDNIYRSKAYQQYLWDRSMKKYTQAGMSYEEAYVKTGTSIAVPGHSEHQTGLAADINGPDETYAWLAENCWDYGFILRYPADKTEVTGIIYEPWHFRYVGTELSLELKELGLCLEEYMASLTPATE